MPTIYPLLKPHDWPHKDHVVSRQLFDGVEGVPIIAFGFDAGENYQFLPVNEANDPELVYELALENLAALDYPLDLDDKHGLKCIFSSGREFSAERVLDRATIRECHRLLESDRIIVAAPRRTCFYAASISTDEQLAMFIDLVVYTYEDDSYGHAPISTALYVFEGGALQRVMFASDFLEPDPPQS